MTTKLIWLHKQARNRRWVAITLSGLLSLTFFVTAIAKNPETEVVIPARGFGAEVNYSLMDSAEQTVTSAPLCRLGVNHVSEVGSFSTLALAPLRLGWYQDYRVVTAPPRPNGAEHVQTIRLGQNGPNSYLYSPDRATILTTIAQNPGSIWFIGNEPDRRAYQDDVEPQVYALAYHDLYALIKGEDASARVFAGSIVQATEVRIKYLNKVLASYRAQFSAPLPTDGWSIHGFVLNEVSCDKNPDEEHLSCTGAEIPPGVDDATGLVLDPADTPPGDWIERNDDFGIFRENVERFRAWMARNGYRQLPLFMSEYGILIRGDWYPQFTPERVNAFMNQTLNYLLTATDANLGMSADNNRLVQRLSWYSTNDKNFNGYLFDINGELSPMGSNYANYVAGISEETDFVPAQFAVSPPMPLIANGNVTFTLQATVANAGNTLTTKQFRVRFFHGAPDAGGVQIGAEQNVALAGCGSTQVVQVQWPDVPPGEYDLYVQLLPADSEDNAQNNVISQRVFFVTHQTVLPLVLN